VREGGRRAREEAEEVEGPVSQSAVVTEETSELSFIYLFSMQKMYQRINLLI
jgi:hypothetical protein